VALEGTQLNLNREQREAKEALEAEVNELKAAQETESTDDGATLLAEKEAALAALMTSFEVRFSPPPVGSRCRGMRTPGAVSVYVRIGLERYACTYFMCSSSLHCLAVKCCSFLGGVLFPRSSTGHCRGISPSRFLGRFAERLPKNEGLFLDLLLGKPHVQKSSSHRFSRRPVGP
jgi:hypothetical protein